MLGMTPLKGKNASRAAAEYFGQSDGGYYLDGSELRREWGGKGAAMLGLTGTPRAEQFKRLLKGMHPETGQQLTALLREKRTVGTDITASLPKGVTGAIERGDERIMPVVVETAKEVMADIEAMAMTRVRKDGANDARITGNMVWLMAEHPEGRPTQEDGMSDYDRHLHFIVMNETWDAEEQKWKALKTDQIIELRKYFSHRFDLLLSARLADLGYGIKTEWQPDKDNGGMRYRTWDIAPAPGHEQGWQSGKDKNSRRHAEIVGKEKEIIGAWKAQNPDAPDELSAVARDKLAATTRRGKRKGKDAMTLDDLRAYWDGRLTPEEKAAIDATIERAKRGDNPRPENRAAEARTYAVAHHFQTHSVVDFRDLAATAMERCMGSSRPEDFAPDAWRAHGLLFEGDKVSTQAVLDQETRIIEFARAGKGIFRPIAPGKADGLDGLSDEQKAAVRHVWESKDRVMLIRGAPGAGKTTMMRPALDRLGVPAVLLAPSSDASRTSLRKEGFEDANTVAAFLGESADGKRMREQARGGIIWIDEGSLLAIDDLERVCGLAKELNARIVLQGDPRQHKAVQRHGNMLEVLEGFAGLPVATLSKIQRQKGEYAEAVAAIRGGEYERGVDMLYRRGWIVGGGHDALVERYASDIERKGKSVLVVDPTHKDGDALSEKLRALRRARGLIRGEERSFDQLVPLNWSDAQKGDALRYAGDEVVQFFRNSGAFKAGERVKASELLPRLADVKPEHFAVFRQGEVSVAEGDAIRITTNGRDVTGKHRLDNGRIDTIRGFTKDGDIVLANGWVMGRDFAHFKHGLVSTSPASQSKTEDFVHAAMPKATRGAINAEQFLVTLSRGRERATIYTDLTRDELVAAIRRADNRLSATELFHGQPPAVAVPSPARAAAASAEASTARDGGQRQRFLERLRWDALARRSARPQRQAEEAAPEHPRIAEFLKRMRWEAWARRARDYHARLRRRAATPSPPAQAHDGPGYRAKFQQPQKEMSYER